MDIPLQLALNMGTTAMFLLVALSIAIRQRHFNTHGKEAFAVVLLFVFVTATLRWIAVNHADWLPVDYQRLANGYIAIVCASIQGTIAYQAEVELKMRKMRDAGKELLA